ncbi:MAG: hypothetical protein KA341_16135 [Saprospiraceae bacterium]|nr:hypothetical protein [Saprospiraceae bacterium]
MHHEDGRVIKTGNNWLYQYWIKDHLGNVRVTFSDYDRDAILTPFEDIKSRNDYYSFGMEWNNWWELGDTINPVNKYRYNGKEFVEEMGWKNLDFGLRNMDPILGRMMQVDPLSDKYPGMSPFQYAGNNPIAFIDMKGDSISPHTIRAVTPTVKPSDKIVANPILKFAAQMVEGAVEGVNYMVRSPFYGRGEGVPKVFEDGHTIKESEESQTMAVDGLLTIAPLVGKGVKPTAAAVKTSTSLVQANRTAGNLFRDELAVALRAEGRTVNTEVFKRTPFGPRYMDLDVWHNGVNLGGIETKVGASRYLPLQRLKDAWLGANGYPVNLVRKPGTW